MSQSDQDLEKLATFLDSSIRLPYGLRIGWDGLLGLIPGLGDFATNLMSFYIVIRGAMLGCSPSVVARMGINVLVDNLLDAIPVLGIFFDFVWRSNEMNLRLIRQYQAAPQQTKVGSRLIVALVLLIFLALTIATVVLTFMLARWLWDLVASQGSMW